jgi:hypothetical protein
MSNFQGQFSNVFVEMFNENLVFFFHPNWRGLLEPEWCTLYYAVEVKKLVNHKLFYELSVLRLFLFFHFLQIN